MSQTGSAPNGAAHGKYRTTPDHSITGMPPGVPFIIGNEAAERFSFYGMRAILTVFMTKYLVDATGADAGSCSASIVSLFCDRTVASTLLD